MNAHLMLSVLDLEMLRLLADGLNHDEIAKALEISRSTLKRHLKRVKEVLGARNSVQTLIIAVQSGLIRYPTRSIDGFLSPDEKDQFS